MNVFSEYIGPILLGILCSPFVAVIVGMMIMTLILVIRRFWNGLLKEEGYLAFTLPVEVWQLIVSKVIVAAIVKSDQWSDCGTFLPDPVPWHLQGDLYSMKYTFQCNMEINDRRAWCLHRCSDRAWNPVPDRHKHLRNLYALCIYVSGSVDGGASGSRIISGFISANIAVSTITNIGTMIIMNILPDNMVIITANNAGLIFTLYLLIMLVINGIQLAVYHVITEYVLTNKLNLE